MTSRILPNTASTTCCPPAEAGGSIDCVTAAPRRRRISGPGRIKVALMGREPIWERIRNRPLCAMSPLPRISLPAPCQALRQGKDVPCCCTESRRQSIDFAVFSVGNRKNFPVVPWRQGNSRHSPEGEGRRGAARSCLAAPPSLYLALGRRSVAQPGRALLSGGRGRRFKSSHSDQHFPPRDPTASVWGTWLW